MIDFLEKNLSPQAFSLLLLCICAIYIWYLLLRNKLLKEQIEFEKEKRENFLNELQKLKDLPPLSHSGRKKTLNPKRILIVDDEPWLREMIVAILSRHYPGIQISQASDGVEALERISSNKPSVLITDVMMPRMDGFTLLNTLQKQGEMVPTLVFSGYMSPHLFEEEISNIRLSKSDGIVFLPKPFKSEEFLQAVETLLARSNESASGA